MSNQNYTATISVDQSPKEALEAIRNVRGWWSEEIDGSTAKVGDEFRYHYQNLHTCTMKLVELVPYKRVAWLVTDNYFSFTEDKTEWKGTKVVFDIAKKGDKTEIQFTHEGLVPAYECYNVCSDAWGSYIRGSLKSLIATGKGSPNQKETCGKGLERAGKSVIERQTLKATIPNRGGTKQYVPSMHRKRSSHRRRSRILGRSSGCVHRQAEEIFHSGSSRSVSENKGEIRWQPPRRETWNTERIISR